MDYSKYKCLTFGESGLVQIASSFRITGQDEYYITLKDSVNIDDYNFVILPFFFDYTYDEGAPAEYGSVFICPASDYHTTGPQAFYTSSQVASGPEEITFYVSYTGDVTNNRVIIQATGGTIGSDGLTTVDFVGIWGVKG